MERRVIMRGRRHADQIPVVGATGPAGPAGNNAINSITRREFVLLKSIFWIAITVFFSMVIGIVFTMSYPFKTLDIAEPVPILNPGHRVPLGGTVRMQVDFTKYIDNPGLIIISLVRKTGKEVEILASSSWVSYRKRGSGSHVRTFPMPQNIVSCAGKEYHMILTIQYDLYGVRNFVRQFTSEGFKIHDPEKEGG
jgi:hypothetical protein